MSNAFGWDNICMSIAYMISNRSTCSNPDRKVGCVVTDETHSRILAWGYNGVASKEEHKCEFNKDSVFMNEFGNRCNCVHAEQNCLVKLNTFDSCKKYMYLTLSPCMLCARLIVNSKIDRVYIYEIYKDERPIRLLLDLGIEVYQYNEKIDDYVLSSHMIQ